MEISVVGIIAVLIVLAQVWWLFSTYVLPRLPEPFRTLIIVVLVIAVCLWLLSLIGWLGPIRLR